MPIPGVFTTDGGAPYTRFKAPVISGTLGLESASAGSPVPGGFMCIQSSASATSQIIATSSAPATASYVYIPQGSQAMTSSATANIAANPPYTGCGAAIYYDFTRKKLSVWSTGNGTGEWFSVSLSSS